MTFSEYGNQVAGHAGPVLDGVEPRLDCSGNDLRDQSVHRDPCPGGVRRGRRRSEYVRFPVRGEPPAVVGEVADELDPAAARRRLFHDRGGEPSGLHLPGQAREISRWWRQEPAGSDGARQAAVGSHLCRPAIRAARFPDQQHSGRQLGPCTGLDALLGGGVRAGGTGQRQVGVAVHQAGDQPAAVEERVGSGYRLEGDASIDDVHVPDVAAGKHVPAQVEPAADQP
jgi:hypothetical protein